MKEKTFLDTHTHTLSLSSASAITQGIPLRLFQEIIFKVEKEKKLYFVKKAKRERRRNETGVLLQRWVPFEDLNLGKIRILIN